jgi:hypothetical protein
MAEACSSFSPPKPYPLSRHRGAGSEQDCSGQCNRQGACHAYPAYRSQAGCPHGASEQAGKGDDQQRRHAASEVCRRLCRTAAVQRTPTPHERRQLVSNTPG